MYSQLPLFHLQEKNVTLILFTCLLVPFCYTVDLSTPSTIMESPATSPHTPGISTLHPPATDASQYTSAPASLIENAFETTARKLNLNAGDHETLSGNNRKKSAMAGVSLNVTGMIKTTKRRIVVKQKVTPRLLSFPAHTGLTEPQPVSSRVHRRTAGSGRPMASLFRMEMITFCWLIL